ncbi:hypothetical protein R3P38DRAFT_2811595 [Favolaschia claudopus]
MMQQKQRAANHQRTTSLVENAAASSGVRWPAPESPLPEAIAPPPDASDPFGLRATSAGSRMQSQQAAFMQSAQPLKSSFSLPLPRRRRYVPPSTSWESAAILTPCPLSASAKDGNAYSALPSSTTCGADAHVLHPVTNPSDTASPQNGGMPPMLTAQRQQTPALPLPPPMTATASGKSSGGLSAQDLSFFEGL